MKCGRKALVNTTNTNIFGFLKEEIDMKFIEEDSYTCPYCGCIVKREELPNAPEFKDAIFVRDNIRCPNCGNFGMNYMTKGKIGYGMIGYTLSDMNRRR